ncbi:hypothetical protein [Mycoplasma sp. Ms02]|uniref:hypothetical protein n=1 Tax=Mycoplasma sp. Ms02 TaxID=353851 RepID=UPI001C8A274E|nr:hypothetical protein [Mycoplasma sp. Ms02]QZE12245.1 hypothetical protein K4L35_02840 [Mycoplasma sp. Ms02]
MKKRKINWLLWASPTVIALPMISIACSSNETPKKETKPETPKVEETTKPAKPAETPATPTNEAPAQPTTPAETPAAENSLSQAEVEALKMPFTETNYEGLLKSANASIERGFNDARIYVSDNDPRLLTFEKDSVAKLKPELDLSKVEFRQSSRGGSYLTITFEKLNQNILTLHLTYNGKEYTQEVQGSATTTTPAETPATTPTVSNEVMSRDLLTNIVWEKALSSANSSKEKGFPDGRLFIGENGVTFNNEKVADYVDGTDVTKIKESGTTKKGDKFLKLTFDRLDSEQILSVHYIYDGQKYVQHFNAQGTVASPTETPAQPSAPTETTPADQPADPAEETTSEEMTLTEAEVEALKTPFVETNYKNITIPAEQSLTRNFSDTRLFQNKENKRVFDYKKAVGAVLSDALDPEQITMKANSSGNKYIEVDITKYKSENLFTINLIYKGKEYKQVVSLPTTAKSNDLIAKAKQLLEDEDSKEYKARTSVESKVEALQADVENEEKYNALATSTNTLENFVAKIKLQKLYGYEIKKELPLAEDQLEKVKTDTERAELKSALEKAIEAAKPVEEKKHEMEVAELEKILENLKSTKEAVISSLLVLTEAEKAVLGETVTAFVNLDKAKLKAKAENSIKKFTTLRTYQDKNDLSQFVISKDKMFKLNEALDVKFLELGENKGSKIFDIDLSKLKTENKLLFNLTYKGKTFTQEFSLEDTEEEKSLKALQEVLKSKEVFSTSSLTKEDSDKLRKFAETDSSRKLSLEEKDEKVLLVLGDDKAKDDMTNVLSLELSDKLKEVKVFTASLKKEGEHDKYTLRSSQSGNWNSLKWTYTISEDKAVFDLIIVGKYDKEKDTVNYGKTPKQTATKVEVQLTPVEKVVAPDERQEDPVMSDTERTEDLQADESRETVVAEEVRKENHEKVLEILKTKDLSRIFKLTTLTRDQYNTLEAQKSKRIDYSKGKYIIGGKKKPVDFPEFDFSEELLALDFFSRNKAEGKVIVAAADGNNNRNSDRLAYTVEENKVVLKVAVLYGEYDGSYENISEAVTLEIPVAAE